MDDQDKSKEFDGKKEKITGSLDEESMTIHVSHIEEAEVERDHYNCTRQPGGRPSSWPRWLSGADLCSQGGLSALLEVTQADVLDASGHFFEPKS